MTSEKVRLIVDLPKEDASRLQQLAENSGTNQSTALVKAVRLAEIIQTFLDAGSEIQVINRDGSRESLLK